MALSLYDPSGNARPAAHGLRAVLEGALSFRSGAWISIPARTRTDRFAWLSRPSGGPRPRPAGVLFGRLSGVCLSVSRAFQLCLECFYVFSNRSRCFRPEGCRFRSCDLVDGTGKADGGE